jgi:hydroxymethylpyrimidine/phosphomethylpyrimidine kinase
VAGSDPSGGAGLQADLKVFHRHGVYGAAAATLLTVQDSRGVQAVHLVPPPVVEAQVRAVLDDFPVEVVKTGALGSLAIAQALVAALGARRPRLVIDPVMVSTSGKPLLAAADALAVADLLFPRAALVTPNLDEAALLLGWRPDRDSFCHAAQGLSRRYGCPFLLKGGHLEGDPLDVLSDGSVEEAFASVRIATRYTHGTGCVLASSLAANLALGHDLTDSVKRSRAFLARALAGAPGLGAGHGPMDLLASP